MLGIISTKESANPSLPLGTTVDGPDGHNVEQHHRGTEFGSRSNPTHVPVKGTSSATHPLPSMDPLPKSRNNR
jgi:hypothetical protein